MKPPRRLGAADSLDRLAGACAILARHAVAAAAAAAFRAHILAGAGRPSRRLIARVRPCRTDDLARRFRRAAARKSGAARCLRASQAQKKIRPAEAGRKSRPALGRNDRHDAERVRIDDQDLVAHDDVSVGAILRDDLHEYGREDVETHVPRHHRVHGDREVHVVDARTRLFRDDLVDLGLLLGRELDRSAACGRAGLALLLSLGLRPAFGALLLGSPHALAGLGALLLGGALLLDRAHALAGLGALLLGALFLVLGHAWLRALLLGGSALLASALLLSGSALLASALLLGGSALLTRALTHLA